jgi:hypothetical protein
MRKFAKLSVKIYEVPFQRKLAVWPVMWNMPANSKRGLDMHQMAVKFMPWLLTDK